MIVNIIGASGSGKTTLVEYLLSRYSDFYRKLISYTTRTPRITEQQGIHYNFVKEEFFSNNRAEILFKRERPDGIYGVHKNDLNDQDKITLLTTFPPKGVSILEELGFQTQCFYLSVDVEERKKRMLRRGDSALEVSNRILADSKEYSDEAIGAIFSKNPIHLLDGHKPLKELALLIHDFMIKSIRI